MRRSRDPGTFQSTLDHRAWSVSDARAAFSEWLTGIDVAGEFCDEMAVVFSELAANASAATPPAGGAPTVRAWVEDGDVVLEVVNPVGGTHWQGDRGDVSDPLRPRGRGLMIARAYTDVLDVEAADGRIVVRCRRRIEG